MIESVQQIVAGRNKKAKPRKCATHSLSNSLAYSFPSSSPLIVCGSRHSRSSLLYLPHVSRVCWGRFLICLWAERSRFGSMAAAKTAQPCRINNGGECRHEKNRWNALFATHKTEPSVRRGHLLVEHGFMFGFLITWIVECGKCKMVATLQRSPPSNCFQGCYFFAHRY